MQQYLNLLQDIIDNGFDHEDRTGSGRRSVYCRSLRFNLEEGFPIVTTRKIHTKSFIEELLWHISGSEDTSYLKYKGVKIWNKWEVEEKHVDDFIANIVSEDLKDFPHLKEFISERYLNRVGKIYGPNWRHIVKDVSPFVPIKEPLLRKSIIEDIEKTYDLHSDDPEFTTTSKEDFIKFNGAKIIDQLLLVINSIKKKPFSARHVITSWIPQNIPDENYNPQENVLMNNGALAPCPTFMQFFVTPIPKERLDFYPMGIRNKLSMMLYIRSSDGPVGLCFNIGQYALFLSMIAQVTNMSPYEFIVNTGDTHIYLNQIDLVKEQLKREPKKLSKLILDPSVKDIDDFKSEHIKILDYQHHEAIEYPVSA